MATLAAHRMGKAMGFFLLDIGMSLAALVVYAAAVVFWPDAVRSL